MLKANKTKIEERFTDITPRRGSPEPIEPRAEGGTAESSCAPECALAWAASEQPADCHRPGCMAWTDFSVCVKHIAEITYTVIVDGALSCIQI